MPRAASSSLKSRLPRLPFLVCAMVFAGCGDDLIEPDVTLREVGVAVASTDISLTVFDVEDPTMLRTVGLGPDGSPVTLAIRGGLADHGPRG